MRFRQAVCASATVLGLLSGTSSQGQGVSNVMLVADGAVCRYLVPSSGALGMTWVQQGFDDSAWTSGPSGIGYESNYSAYSNLIQTTVPVGTSDVYCRWTFGVPLLPSPNRRVLHVQYDGGFVAYINGTKVAQANCPTNLAYNSLAPATNSGLTNVDFDISSFTNLTLQAFTNVLAVQVLNHSASGHVTKLLILPTLEIGTFRIQTFDGSGDLTWTNAFPSGVVAVETAPALAGPWSPGANYYTAGWGSAAAGVNVTPAFCRLGEVDLSTNNAQLFTDLTQSYGLLETIAGNGLQSANGDSNLWLTNYEGGPALQAALSLPHAVFGDSQGNVLIEDESSDSILKVTPDGTIHTIAGTHVQGNGTDAVAVATTVALNLPNGGFMMQDGTLYILDTGNSKVRVLQTNGMMSTLFTDPYGITGGRGIWVTSNSNSTQVWYVADQTVLRECTVTTNGPSFYDPPYSFLRLGYIAMDETTSNIYAPDTDDNKVWLCSTNGLSKTLIAGNGTTSGGGDGFPALSTGLNAPRCIVLCPSGGYFIGEFYPNPSDTNAGCRIWYVDAGNIIHLCMSGAASVTNHPGDGAWFYATPTTPLNGGIYCMNLDAQGNLLIGENNYGYIRRIQFVRLSP